MPGLPPDRRSRLRPHVSRADRDLAHGDAERCGVGEGPCPRLLALRRVRGGLPGAHRHPADADRAAQGRGAGQDRAAAGAGCLSRLRVAAPPAGALSPQRTPGTAGPGTARARWPHSPRPGLLRRVDAHARSAGDRPAHVPGALGRARARRTAMTTRAAFFERIRAEVARGRGPQVGTAAARPATPREQLDLLRRELSERWRENLERFAREFERVGGVLHRVGDVRDVPGVVARIAAERGMSQVVAWPAETLGADVVAPLAAHGLRATAMPATDVTPAERQRLRALAAAADLGVTGADVAIAETGTLVVVSGAGRPRSASLLPACRVAVFDRDVPVASLRQMGLVLEAWHEGDEPSWWGAAINFITGPSRTADIELTLTRGVHGPKEVHAIFVEQGLLARRG